jgi:hypothetical protein
MAIHQRVEIEGEEDVKTARGVTRRVVVLSLVLAVFFGYIIPLVDVKLSNTFLGAAHLPPGAIAVLLHFAARCKSASRCGIGSPQVLA